MATESKNHSKILGVSILGIGVGAILTTQVLGEYGLHIAIISLYYVLLSSAWNLVAGYTGQVSFAQAAFAAVGAYSSGLIAVHFGFSILISIVLGAAIAALLGWALGRLGLPLGGKYLSLVTLSFSEILRLIFTNEERWTRGTQGLQVPGLFLEYSKLRAFWLFFGVTTLVLVFIFQLLKRRTGLLFRAVMSDELAAASLGIATTRVRILAFTLSSAISGLAGALYGHYLELVTPEMGSLDQMFLILAMTWVGGKGTWFGPVLGAVALEVLSEQIRKSGQYSILVFGLVTLILIRFAPKGIWGWGRTYLMRRGSWLS